MKRRLICSSIGSIAAAAGLTFWVITWKVPGDPVVEIAGVPGKTTAPYFHANRKSDGDGIAARPVWRADRRATKNTSPIPSVTIVPFTLELISISAGDAGSGFALIAKGKAPTPPPDASKEGSKEGSKEESESAPKKDPPKTPSENEPARLYALGDEIPGTGLTVASINADTVTLSGRNPQELKIDWTSAAVNDRLAAAAAESSPKSEENDKKSNEEQKPKRDLEKNSPK